MPFGGGSHASIPAWSLLPHGLRVRGGNVAPNAAQQADSDTWGSFWTTRWDWTGTVKLQIDLAQTLGLNAVRIIGCGDSVARGTASGADWKTNLTTVLDYCRSIGMYFYLTLANGNDPLGTSAFTSAITPIATLATTYPDVVFACDVFNEAVPPYDTTTALPSWLTSGGPTWNAAVRALNGWTFPIAYSCSGISGDVNWQNRCVTAGTNVANALAPDFHDMHWYIRNATWRTDDLAVFWWPSLPLTNVLIGEFGSPLSDTTANRVQEYTYMNAMVDDATHRFRGPKGERLAGALAWALGDQSATSSNEWSIFDDSSDEANVLKQMAY